MLNMMDCVTWYHLFNLKNRKNIQGAVLLLVKSQASACNFTKSNTLPRSFSRLSNCAHGTKSRKTSQIIN